jgi:hypothetical protein
MMMMMMMMMMIRRRGRGWRRPRETIMHLLSIAGFFVSIVLMILMT